MDESIQGDIKEQVENRLDVMFGEIQGDPENQPDQESPPESPLKPLKAILLAVDWEITDETLANLLGEAKRLEEIYGTEKIPLTLLQILTSIGKYLRLNKGKAHPSTNKLINSVYLALEKTVATDGISQQEKQRLLLSEVAKFKKLKEEISLRREAKAEERSDESVAPRVAQSSSPPAGAEEESSWVGGSPIAPHEAFAIAVEEIKDLIRAEFKALRTEIRLWRSSK